jgi:hypothetical protein
MAKKLLHHYTFTPGTNTIVIDGIFARERFLLITNTQSEQQVYVFNDGYTGFANITFDYPNEQTTVVLDYDCSGMSSTDKLQIFVEQDYQTIEPSATFTDPVSKLRVSQPENLIDTDFEYGLQSTKWETLELTKNIPTFYSRDGDQPIPLTSMQSSEESNIITVVTSEPHGLQRGSPIIVIGSASSTTDGGFLVASATNTTTFTYRSKAIQSAPATVLDTYTQLFSGSIYSGTEFKLQDLSGITTDSANPSTLTVSTVYPTRFTNGTSMGMSNTAAQASITFNTDDVIVDNFTSVDISRAAATPAPDTNGGFALGGIQPFSFVPQGVFNREPFYFTEGTTSISNGVNVTFTEPHGFSTYDAVTYICDTTSNSRIGGLVQGYTYWVVKVDDYTIRFHTIRNASFNYVVNITSNGVSGGILRSCLVPNIGGGVQFQSSANYIQFFAVEPTIGPSIVQRDYRVIFSRANGGTPANFAYTTNPYFWYSASYDYFFNLVNLNTNGNFARVASTSGGGYLSLSTRYDDYGAIRIAAANAVDAGSFYLPSHGLNTGDIITITATTGTLPNGANNGGTYKAVKISDDRISLQTTAGNTVYLTSSGSSDLVYRVQAKNPRTDLDRIVIPGLTLSDGDAVKYDANGGTEIGGLTDAGTYYIAFSDGSSANLSTDANFIGTTVTVYTNSSFYTNLSSNYFQNITHGFNTGDRILYGALNSTVVGLVKGAFYFVRTLSSNSFALYYSAADAAADTNRVQFYGYSNNASTFTRVSVVDLTSAPVGDVQKMVASFIGAADGVYSVASTAEDQLSFTLSASDQILPKFLSRTCQQCFDSQANGFFIQDHGVVSGDALTYTAAAPNNVTGITSGVTYYGIQVNRNIFRLAATQADALAGTALTLTPTTVTVDQTGVLTFTGDGTIIGSIAGKGTVSYAADGTTLTGDGTTFTSYFNKGDTIKIGDATVIGPREVISWSTADYIQLDGNSTGITNGDLVRFSTDDGQASPTNVNYNTNYYARIYDAFRIQLFYTAAGAIANSGVIQLTNSDIVGTFVTVYPNPGALTERVVKYVNSDTQLEVTEAFPATAVTGANYFLNTGLLLRSDGFALHRPYDGGVELIPSTNPDSAMIRQTRKYFRYQSGKGIQVSYAVNFSPTAGIETYTRDATVDGITTATITSRFPHRLTAGLNIVISGSTNTSLDSIGLKNYDVAVVSPSGIPQFSLGEALPTTVTLYEGRTYRFDQSDASNASYQLLFSLTEDGDNNGGTEYTTGVTKVGTPGSAGAYTEIVVPSGVATLYTYASGSPGYGFTAPTDVDPNNNQANLWNGTLKVTAIINDLPFRVQLLGQPSDAASQGLVEYYVQNWENSALRCGLMDDQNGLYFEYDGQEISVCRRSSTAQVSGYASVQFRSGEITGTSTAWQSQLSIGDSIVIRGQTYIVLRIDSDTLMYISPGYRGITASKVIITKTEVTRVPQSQWNIDVCDGTGPSGFYLNINKIQMAYMDYSWYGAGKARFGFKDQYGEVRYVHEFTHNNRKTEAFMRSGNLPARYEIQNLGAPTYVPALAHWGTSVIMDGRFDDDKAYTFNANSNNITQTGSAALTVSGKIDYLGEYTQRYANRYNVPIGYALLLDAPDANLAAITKGVAVTGTGLAANTIATLPSSSLVAPYQPYLPSVLTREGTASSTQEVRDLLVLDRAPTAISGTSSTYSFAIGAAGTVDVTTAVPLISVRLAPSVDTGTPGFLGERDIINRMQLILQQVGILTTHAAEIQLVLNGQLSTNAWQRVTSPSLSQLLVHSSSDTITGGANIFQFRVQGGTGTTGRTQVLTTQQLGEVATLGNAILGGDNTFPDGPDVLTVVAILTEDPSSVSGNNPYIVSGRISWTESQA